ncbi:unnamed protein product [Adineta steineri]|uniref:Cadherin domain-containing protein n=1 Tax=Adineta steineri TaxID=433720 RepID=A0A814I454_9BILA|nr:unnamed protein product [Adineta steineri]
MLWSIFQVIIAGAVLANTKATSEETNTARTKPNWFDPVLSSNAYVGHMKENERIVHLEPHLYASDRDPSMSPTGKICGYELSLHKHDDTVSEVPQNIPFIVEFNNEQAIIKLKSSIDKVDCEIKQNYRLFIRAYDCGNGNQRRYSERSSLIITIDDVNEFAPVFTHKNYIFKLHQDQICSSCRVEATDDDCANTNHRVCDYQIRTPNVPFSIDSNGSISITKPLMNDKYEFDVVAIDCYPLLSDVNTKLVSEPTKVTIKVVKSCKPSITDNNPTKLTILSDHTHIFDTVHVDTCDETCAVEEIAGIVTFDTNGIDSGCNLEQCSSVNREYVLIPKDVDYNQAPKTRSMSFDGFNQASIIPKADFSGQLNNNFTIRMWMKHSNEENSDKEHIFCKSDEKLKNRHHIALLIQDSQLKLLIRKGPLSSNDKNVYTSEWVWNLVQINDNQWHSYKLFVNYPNKIDLYIDDQLFIATNDNFHTVEDFALPTIDGTEGTVFAVGACWHGRASHMVQYFQGDLSGLVIEQKEELSRSISCIQDCQQYLDMPDVQTDSGIEFSSNSNRTIWNVRTDSSESFEQLLKHIVYRNTFDPIGPSGQRTVSIQTIIKCLGENYTYNLPTFSRRLAIDEIIHPTNIELKGDTNFYVPESVLNQGIYLFRNLSILTDAIKKDQVDISDCSINTTPDLSNDEQFILPDENLELNNIRKDHTQTGLVLSGSSSIDTYRFILQQIAYVSKSPVKYIDRTFSLVCIGVHEQVSTNEIRVRVHVEKQIAPPAPVAAVSSNKLYVDNIQIEDSLLDMESSSRLTSWPIAVGVCVSVSLASVLILYLVVRIRSGSKQRNPLSVPGDDIHSQMEWEDDIGLNIIVNPLEETKKPVQPINIQNMEEMMQEYEGGSSSEEDDECDGQSHNEYSSEEEEDEDYDNNQINQKKHNHQLEWDDDDIEYGPKKV